jgi:formamidopyrimidine-DNA glycosylase
MPELAEVEIVRRNLSRWVAGRAVRAVDVRDRARLDGPVEALVGATFTGFGRHGKMLLAATDRGLTMLSHLGMTGKWLADPAEGRAGVRIVLSLAGLGPGSVALVDPRRFGHTWIVADADVQAHPRLRDLGPDLLDPAVSCDVMQQRLGERRSPLKAGLLDQRAVAGAGNIAVSEACFRAGLHPHARCDSLAPTDWQRLLSALRAHFAHVLETEDGDEVHYVSQGGEPSPFLVYDRKGEPCPRCGAAIVRGVSGGRSSYWCLACQV